MDIKFYSIKHTDEYRNAEEVWTLLSESYRYKLENLVSKEVYSALLFYYNALLYIEVFCDKFFECKEKGLSYQLGCYFQKREYLCEGMIKSDINKFTALLTVYDKESYPEECRLVRELIEALRKFEEKWKSYEESNPELFE